MYPKFEPGFCLCTDEDPCTYCVQWVAAIDSWVSLAETLYVETP